LEKIYSFRGILKIAVPATLNTTSTMLVMIVDMLCLAYHSPETLASAGAALFTSTTILLFFTTAASLSSSYVAQGWGKSLENGALKEAAYGVVIGFILSAIYLLCMPIIILVPALFLTNANDVQLSVEQYLKISAFFSPVIIMNTCMAAYYIGTARQRKVFLIELTGQIVTILATIILVFGWFKLPSLGITGAALGTLAGAIATFFVYLALTPATIWTAVRDRHFEARSRSILVKRIKASLIRGAAGCSDEISNTVYIYLMGILGSVALSANNIAITINYMVAFPVIGIAIASGVITAQCLGSESFSVIPTVIFRVIIMQLLFVAVTALLLITWPQYLVGAFNQSSASPEVKDAAETVTRYIWVYGAALSFSSTSSCVMAGLGLSGFQLWVRILLVWGISLPLVYLSVTAHFEALGSAMVWAWCIFSLFEGIVGAVSLARIKIAISRKENFLADQMIS
jgi:MATE family multidrug resistance protein